MKVYGSRSPHPDVDLVLTCSAWGAASYGHNPAAAELSTDSSVTQKQHFSGVLRLAVASGQLHVAARGDIFTQHSWWALGCGSPICGCDVGGLCSTYFLCLHPVQATLQPLAEMVFAFWALLFGRHRDTVSKRIRGKPLPFLGLVFVFGKC